MRSRRNHLLQWVAVGLVLAGVAGAVGWQHWQATLLRLELEPLRDESRSLVVLRQENERLRGAQPAAAEYVRLRADHEAIGRLRAELDALRAKLPPPK